MSNYSQGSESDTFIALQILFQNLPFSFGPYKTYKKRNMPLHCIFSNWKSWKEPKHFRRHLVFTLPIKKSPLFLRFAFDPSGPSGPSLRPVKSKMEMA